MSRVSALPFRTPRPGRITLTPWVVAWAGSSAETPEKLEGWDYGTDCTFARVVGVDLDGVFADCGLPRGSALRLTVHWWSTLTNLRGCLPEVPVQDGGTRLEFRLPGYDLGGTLRLETRLVTARLDDAPPLAPRRAGSILWRDISSTVLEGESARFPMQLTDFANVGAPGASEGAWYLSWTPDDLEASFLGSTRLLVNSRHPTISRLFDEGADPTPELRAVLSVMRFDVARQLVTGALDSPGFDDGIEWPPQSLGAVLSDLLATLFPGETVGSLRSFRQLAPALFDARIQSATRMLMDV